MLKSLSIAVATLLFIRNANAELSLDQKINDGEYQQITSVLVNHKGKTILESYYGDGSPEQANDIRSASKTFTALAAGIAIEKGLIPSVESHVMEYLPEYKSPQNPFMEKQNMSFQDLLTMTSSLECNDWNSYSLGNEERMYLQSDWTKFITDLPKRGIPPWEIPESQRFNKKAFSYCTGGVFLIGKAIENASGTRADKFLHRHLFSQMGIENLYWPMSPKGHAQTGGGVRITSRDLLKIGELILNDGKWSSDKSEAPKQLLSAEWIAQMKTPYVEIDPDRNIKYGYLLWIYQFQIGKANEDKTITAWAASGNGGNYLWIVPELQLTAVITSVAYNQSYMHRQSQDIFENHIIPIVTQEQ